MYEKPLVGGRSQSDGKRSPDIRRAALFSPICNHAVRVVTVEPLDGVGDLTGAESQKAVVGYGMQSKAGLARAKCTPDWLARNASECLDKWFKWVRYKTILVKRANPML